jgi:hypothetical protein
LDGEVVKTGKLERFDFTWEGQDENDPAFGSGWLKLSGKDKSKGRIKFHLGDSSEFLAIRGRRIKTPSFEIIPECG